MKSITAKELIENVNTLTYTIVSGADHLEKCNIKSPRVQRPGLALAGYFTHMRPDRVQLFGETEIGFMQTLSSQERERVLMTIANINQCTFIISKNIPVPQELLEAAKAHSVAVLSVKESTVETNTQLELYLDDALAPETIIHGVCMEVYGIGIVITGKSGIGKSECALELIKRGHKLVSDDAVIIKRVHNDLIGCSNELLHNYIELRGVGILNISHMFGITAINPRKKLDMIIDFVEYDEWNKHKDVDRIGINNNTKEILNLNLPLILCPVSPGRNMSEIVELAVKNQIIKDMGYDSTLTFSRSVADKINEG